MDENYFRPAVIKFSLPWVVKLRFLLMALVITTICVLIGVSFILASFILLFGGFPMMLLGPLLMVFVISIIYFNLKLMMFTEEGIRSGQGDG